MTEQLADRKIENVFETLCCPAREHMLTRGGGQIPVCQPFRRTRDVRKPCANSEAFERNGLPSQAWEGRHVFIPVYFST
jgi:hypothetical protein